MVTRTFALWIAAMGVLCLTPMAAAAAEPEPCGFSNFVEMRIYSTHEKERDRFMKFFEEHYLESQEVVGMRIWGQFLDLTTARHFVWLRGYRDFDARQEELMGFYMSPVWQETSPEVGTMLVSAEHVHFLEPLGPEGCFAEDLARPSRYSSKPVETQRGVVVAQVFLVEDEPFSEVEQQVRDQIIPALEAQGATSLGLFRSSERPNNVPRLPFIEDETIVVWFASFASQASYEKALRSAKMSREPLEVFVLEPGQRSRLYHRAESP